MYPRDKHLNEEWGILNLSTDVRSSRPVGNWKQIH